jgi:hypothetical protein
MSGKICRTRDEPCDAEGQALSLSFWGQGLLLLARCALAMIVYTQESSAAGAWMLAYSSWAC